MNVQAPAERVNVPFLHHFVLLEPLPDWMMPAHTGEGDRSLTFSNQIKSMEMHTQTHKSFTSNLEV